MIKDDKSRFILLLPSLVSISHELQMFVLFGDSFGHAPLHDDLLTSLDALTDRSVYSTTKNKLKIKTSRKISWSLIFTLANCWSLKV